MDKYKANKYSSISVLGITRKSDSSDNAIEYYSLGDKLILLMEEIDTNNKSSENNEISVILRLYVNYCLVAKHN